jgi:hypothetical protein
MRSELTAQLHTKSASRASAISPFVQELEPIVALALAQQPQS